MITPTVVVTLCAELVTKGPDVFFVLASGARRRDPARHAPRRARGDPAEMVTARADCPGTVVRVGIL